MKFWSWLRRKFFYLDLSRWPYRRRLRPWVVRAAVGLVVLFGTIVFAVRAAGRDPFGPTNAANPQLKRIADDLDRLATASQSPRSTSAKQTAKALAISGRYSRWRNRLTTKEQTSADATIPSKLADAFAGLANGILGPGTKQLLTSLFSELLAPQAAETATAAASLAAVASLLPATEQALLPAALSRAMASALDGVVHGGSEQFGKQAIATLFNWLGGNESSANRTETIKVKVVPPAPVRVKLTPTAPLKVKLTPTSFIWGGHAWGWGRLARFKLAFTKEHKGETKACITQQLVALYEHHPVIRQVFAIATPRRRAIVPCT